MSEGNRYGDAREFLHGPSSFRSGDAYGELLGGVARPLRRHGPTETLIASNLAAMVRKSGKWMSGLFRPVLLSGTDVLRPAAAVGMTRIDPRSALPEPVAILEVEPTDVSRLVAMLECPTVATIILCSADTIEAKVWERVPDGWTRRTLESPDDRIPLAGTGVSVRLGDAYRRTEPSPSGLTVVSVVASLPAPLPSDATESEASAYADSLAAACREVFAEGRGEVGGPALPASGHWLDRLDYGHVVDAEAALRAKDLWQSVEAWKEAEKARNPRYALRELMSDLSEEAWHASWQPGVEHVLWDAMVRGDPAVLDLTPETLGRLRSLHLAAGGWWRWGGGADGGLEFLTTKEWTEAFDGRA